MRARIPILLAVIAAFSLTLADLSSNGVMAQDTTPNDRFEENLDRLLESPTEENPAPPTQRPEDGQPGQMPDALEDSAGNATKAPAPLDLVMKDGIPEDAAKRAVLRDDLYALLASASNAKEAKKIAAQIERVWLTSGSDTVTVLMARATRALKAKDQKLALELLDGIVELAPDNAEAWNRRAFVHYSSKNYRAAVGDLRRALALDQNHYKALDGLASIFQQIGDDAKALQVYEQLREVYPFWPDLDKTYETLREKVGGRGI
ncbi:MAG: tetratricopeptide repeat protein [Alphaproteobacteria bacterium]|nr:tetratricopeptide repeat protein [Alphaproteobacteria bacterium]